MLLNSYPKGRLAYPLLKLVSDSFLHTSGYKGLNKFNVYLKYQCIYVHHLKTDFIFTIFLFKCEISLLDVQEITFLHTKY